MEQTNLIVTPDGKTWDQATRDMSYYGPKYQCTLVGTLSAQQNLIYQTKYITGGHSSREPHAVRKGFIVNYDRVRAPETGAYLFSGYFRWATSTDERWMGFYDDANGEIVAVWITQSDQNGDQDGVTISGVVHLTKGNGYRLYANTYVKAEAGEYNTWSVTWLGGRN